MLPLKFFRPPTESKPSAYNKVTKDNVCLSYYWVDEDGNKWRASNHRSFSTTTDGSTIAPALHSDEYIYIGIETEYQVAGNRIKNWAVTEIHRLPVVAIIEKRACKTLTNES